MARVIPPSLAPLPCTIRHHLHRKPAIFDIAPHCFLLEAVELPDFWPTSLRKIPDAYQNSERGPSAPWWHQTGAVSRFAMTSNPGSITSRTGQIFCLSTAWYRGCSKGLDMTQAVAEATRTKVILTGILDLDHDACYRAIGLSHLRL